MIRSALSFAFVALLSHAQRFPPVDQYNPPKSRIVHALQFCMAARESISPNPKMPLFTFEFAPPGASGYVSLDGKKVKSFKGEQHLKVYATVAAGKHRFSLQLDEPATNTSMSSHDDFKYCRD